ncbi:MAG: SPOR domain-containing protein, partial [Cohaesibacter sp.]|nr:SPOR domain-containing protein [Cohaesibacter sp.]
PVSKVVQTPTQIRPTSRTSFALNLGQFISLPELRSAWQEISDSQNQLVGDLRPATSIVEAAQNRIQLQLLLGPIQNAAEAATLCVRLKNRGYDCSVSPFQGQALVFNR